MADEGVSDFGVIAWRDESRWNVSQLTDTDELGSIMDQLISKSRQFGGAIALAAIAEDFPVPPIRPTQLKATHLE